MNCFKRVVSLYFLSVCMLYAQNQELAYDFIEIPEALMLNPGMKTGFQWYAGLPLLSGISVAAGTSGVSVHELFADDGVDFNDKVRNRAIYGMGIRDEISTTTRITLLSGGFRARNRTSDFYSFGIYHEDDVIVYWPKDLVILAFEGNANQLGRRFSLGHLKTRGELLNVFHFGINRKIDNNLSLGARAKIYSGILDFNSTNNDGYFVSNAGQNNLIANTLVANMLLRTSGMEAFREVLADDATDDGAGIRQVFIRRGFFGGDLGLGFDLGFSYNLNDQTLLTGSILDVGFLYHSSDVRNFSLEGSATVEGIEAILPDALADPTADLWQELVDDIEGLLPFDENDRNYITFRPTRLYASLRHNFGEAQNNALDCDCVIPATGTSENFPYLNSVGGQLFVINRPRGPQAALTAFYQRRIGSVLALKGTYTVDKFSLSNIGLGMSVQAGPVNFYLLANNLLSYRNIADSHYASLQLGLNIISWGGKNN
jgi:hypothetical protein